MTDFGRTLKWALLIVVQATALGFAANALNPHGLPLVRRPLRETHRLATRSEAVRAEPVSSTPKVISNTPPPVASPKVEPVPAPPPKLAQPAITPPKPAPAPMPLPAKPKAKPASPKKIEALFTTLPDSKALWDKKAAVFVDARHKEDYDAEHIEGAVSLYAEELDKLYTGVLGGVPKDRTIVTYCSDPQCETAITLADALVARGHTHVLILLEGLPGWKDAGYPATAGAKQ